MRPESKLFAGLDGDGDGVTRQHLDLHTEFSGFGNGLRLEVRETDINFAAVLDEKRRGRVLTCAVSERGGSNMGSNPRIFHSPPFS